MFKFGMHLFKETSLLSGILVRPIVNESKSTNIITETILKGLEWAKLQMIQILFHANCPILSPVGVMLHIWSEPDTSVCLSGVYAVLIIPFLKVLTPSILLIHWEYLSLLIFSSCWMAHCLFLASCLLPGPTWWSLDSRQLTWALTAVRESFLLIWLTISANSLSDPDFAPSSWIVPSLAAW